MTKDAILNHLYLEDEYCFQYAANNAIRIWYIQYIMKIHPRHSVIY